MYQQVLSRFGHFNAIQLSDPAPLKDLIMLALKEEDLASESNDNDDLKEKIAEVISLLFRTNAAFMNVVYSSTLAMILYSIYSPFLKWKKKKL